MIYADRIFVPFIKGSDISLHPRHMVHSKLNSVRTLQYTNMLTSVNRSNYAGYYLASNSGSLGPMNLSQSDLDHYRVAFVDMLINSQQIRLEPRPIGEGDSDQISLSCCDRTNCRGVWYRICGHGPKRMGL